MGLYGLARELGWACIGLHVSLVGLARELARELACELARELARELVYWPVP